MNTKIQWEKQLNYCDLNHLSGIHAVSLGFMLFIKGKVESEMRQGDRLCATDGKANFSGHSSNSQGFPGTASGK